MTTAIAARKPIENIAQLLENRRSWFQTIAKGQLDPNRLFQLALFMIGKSPKLAACTPLSLIKCLMAGSLLGLEPCGAGGYWLVPFKTTATLVADYRGLMTLARRAGALSFEAETIRKGDRFKHIKGTSPAFEHEPLLSAAEEPGIAYYCLARLSNPGGAPLTQVTLMSRATVEKHRARSKAKDDGPWVTDFDAMALKTVVKSMCKFLALPSRELALATNLDDAQELGDRPLVDMDLPADVTEGEVVPGEPPPDMVLPGQTKTDRMAAELKGTK